MKRNNHPSLRMIQAILFLFCLNLSGVLTAQSSGSEELVLSFPEAWNMTRKSNPEFFETRVSLSRAAEAADSVLDAFIPQIGANLSAERSSNIYSEESSYSGGTVTEGDRWTLSSGLSARINLSPSMSLAQRSEVLQYQHLSISAAQQERSLYAELQKLWLRILFAQEESEILQGDLKNAENRLNLVQQQYNSGLRSERELLSARLSVARIHPEIERLHSQIERHFLDLKYMIGIPPQKKVELSGDRPPEPFTGDQIPRDQELKDQLAGNLQLQRVYLQKEIRELGLTTTRAEIQRPSPHAGVTIGLGWSSSMTGISSGEAFNTDQFNDQLTLSLGVEIPISAYIPGSAGHRRVNNAQEDLEASEREIKNTLLNQQNRLENLLLDIRLARTNRELNELSLELQRQDYAASQRSYQAGSLSLLDLEEALQKLRDAELNYRQQEQNYLFLLIDLQELIAS